MSLTINIADSTASELKRQAKALGMSVDELIEMLADQFLTDTGPMIDLTDAQMEEIRLSIEDPSPTIRHDQVMAEAKRILAKRK